MLLGYLWVTDYALDQCLTQLRVRETQLLLMSAGLGAGNNNGNQGLGTGNNGLLLGGGGGESQALGQQQQFIHNPSPFFEEQLTAFEVVSSRLGFKYIRTLIILLFVPVVSKVVVCQFYANCQS